MADGTGTASDPWALTTAPGSSAYTMYADRDADGLRGGYRGRFGMYLPPLLEALGLAELTHEARNNRIRAR